MSSLSYPIKASPSPSASLDFGVAYDHAFRLFTLAEDGHIYADVAERMSKDYSDTAQMLQTMHDEEDGHRCRLIELYQSRFGHSLDPPSLHGHAVAIGNLPSRRWRRAGFHHRHCDRSIRWGRPVKIWPI